MSYCLRCLDDFRDDDNGGYNPACRCGINCRSCCENGECEREDRPSDDHDCCGLCDEPWSRCTCDEEMAADDDLAADRAQLDRWPPSPTTVESE